MPRKKKPAGQVPPSLAEDPEQLAAEAAGAPRAGDGAPGPKGEKRKRGRPPGAAAAPAEPVIPFPVEALAVLHRELWTIIARAFRSRYQLTEQGAFEMAQYAEICLRQYVGPTLAEHTPLAGYLMTQTAALLGVMALRAPTVDAETVPTAAEAPPAKERPPEYREPPSPQELGAGGIPGA